MDSSIDPAFLATLIENLAGTWPPGTDEDTTMAAHTALRAMAPRDLIEAMLAGRMIAAHHASLDSFRRAMLPGLANADVTRLRASAIAAGRSFDAALRMLEQRRAAADRLAEPKRPAARPRHASPQDAAPVEDELAAYTHEEIAAAEHAMDNDPVVLAQAELAKRIPLHRFQDMTMDERRIAYAAPAPLTPVQIAVLGARLAARNRRPTAS